ncbi:MAG: VWA domain-containing protein, partial [Lachnospiraceae bacterium]|nr:VWA domain-containing protein [Lachnospiraceae bacterium]
LYVMMEIFIIVFASDYMIACAQGEVQHDKEVVIVIDCSKSMEDVDSQYLAFDFIKGLAASLPMNCEIGLIAYNNEICVSLPIGSSTAEFDKELSTLQYKQYGNAGAGIEAAVALFQNNRSEKRIILLSDGEIMMDSKEGTEESNQLFNQAVTTAKNKGIRIDVLAIGEKIQEGYTVYSATKNTGGNLYEIEDISKLSRYIDKLLFEEWGYSGSHIGKMDGTSAELTASLPDCMMEKVKILLIGEQQNENLTVNCKAGRIDVSKGKKYTVVDIKDPVSADISIQMISDKAMQIDAYLFSEYVYTISTGHSYMEDNQTARFWVDIMNPEGISLPDGHLGNGGMELYLDGEKMNFTISEGKVWFDKAFSQSSTAQIEIGFSDSFGNYYGIQEAKEEVIVPVVEEEPKHIDWFFWTVIAVFIVAVTAVFCISYRKKKEQHTIRRQVVDMGTVESLENTTPKSDFAGKIGVYVMHNRNDIDYPPESINLFARCRRDSITLEWILDTCNLPLDLKGAEKITFKPGADRSLVIKNNSKASVLIGRALLTKGQSYNLYYHEKVTFIFDEEDAEIEVHYKDLKPNER